MKELKTLGIDSTLLFWNSGKRFFYRPFVCNNSFVKIFQSNLKGQFIYPIRQRHCFSIICNKNRTFTVNALFSSVRPPTVFRGIVTIIVHSIERIFFWPLTHVAIKVIKTLPSIAYFYPTTTISIKIWIIRIITSLTHLYPSSIFWYSFICTFYVRHSMSFYALNTSAAICCTYKKIRFLSAYSISTIALKQPNLICSNITNKLNCRKHLAFCTLEFVNFFNISFIHRGIIS